MHPSHNVHRFVLASQWLLMHQAFLYVLALGNQRLKEKAAERLHVEYYSTEFDARAQNFLYCERQSSQPTAKNIPLWVYAMR